MIWESHPEHVSSYLQPFETAALPRTLPSPIHPSMNLLLQPLPPPFQYLESGIQDPCQGGVSPGTGPGVPAFLSLTDAEEGAGRKGSENWGGGAVCSIRDTVWLFSSLEVISANFFQGGLYQQSLPSQGPLGRLARTASP